MKTYTITILISAMVFSMLSLNLYSQGVSDSVYYNRLFYVCKTWGHAKYYHTEIANGSVNWDDELNIAINGAKYASTNASFNDSLQLMLNNAGEMEVNTSILPVVPDSLNNNTDYSWIQDSTFSDTVRALLDTIRTRFKPQNNIYLGQAFQNGNPTFDNDDLYYSGSNFPSENIRLLALFRYWNIVNYFFPYKYMMDQHWDSTLIEFIPAIVESIDAESYMLNIRKLTSRINDTHAYLNSTVYFQWLGNYYPPFLVRCIENEMVITKVLSGISEVEVGDIIKEIDGHNIYSLRDSLRQYSYGSNNTSIERNLNTIIMFGDYGDFQIAVDNGVNIQTKTLSRNANNYNLLISSYSNPIWKDTLVNNTCNFGIVDMAQLETNHISSMFNDLWETDAIIFDIRNYPNGTLWYIVNYLFQTSIDIANFTVPDITYPGTLYWFYENIGFGTPSPYDGKIIILFDERTQSQAEYTCMGLEQYPNSVKIGSTTAAADGNVSLIYLPGNIRTYMTGLGTFYPDYTATQRFGIIPDYEVHPTIEGIRAGRDELMEFALDCFVDVEEYNHVVDVDLFPNPVVNKLIYDISSYDGNEIVELEVYDMLGRSCKQKSLNSKRGKIDFSDVKPGIYVVKITVNNKFVAKSIQKI